MKLVRHLDKLQQFRGGAITIGNFDGVHRGHAKIIERLRHQADLAGGPAVVFTFDPHPVRLLRPEQAPPPLTWTNRKADLLSDLGVDGLIAYPTDKALLQLSAEDFFQSIILEQLDTRAMVEGPNFFFGRDRAGNIDVLRDMCNANNVALEIVTPIEDGDALVSSSRVRTAIAAGDMQTANSMLTRPYRVRGMVRHGASRGASIGFPTANLDAIDTLLPAVGVYAGRAWRGNRSHAAAINIGSNPTFGEDAVKVEVHLLDFDDNLYGQPLEVDILTRLRDIQPFPNVDALVAQLKKDVEATRAAQPPRN